MRVNDEHLASGANQVASDGKTAVARANDEYVGVGLHLAET